MVKKSYLDTGKGRLCYLRTEPNKKQLVFLHGGFGNPGIITNLAALFEPEGFQLIAPYLPGHGQSFSLPNNYSYEDLLDTMREFINRANLHKTVVIGHSLGGRLAFDLRDEFKSVVMISPVLIPIKKTLSATTFALLHDHLKDGAIIGKRAISDLKGNFVNLPAIWQMVQSIPEANMEGDLTNVVMCMGKKDRLLTFPHVESLTTFEFDSGHYLYLSRNQREVFDKIIDFLR